MTSRDRAVSVRLGGDECDGLPATSCFASLPEASRFFERGSLGYSPKREVGELDALLLRTLSWRVGALAVKEGYSSYFADPQLFPNGSIEYDHALVMRDLEHKCTGQPECMLCQKPPEAPWKCAELPSKPCLQ